MQRYRYMAKFPYRGQSMGLTWDKHTSNSPSDEPNSNGTNNTLDQIVFGVMSLQIPTDVVTIKMTDLRGISIKSFHQN